MLARYDCLLIVFVISYFFLFMNYILGRQKPCSCYTFEEGSETKLTWTQARISCEYYNEYLVAMENWQEWEFINKTIKDLTSCQYNEWHIGLFINRTTGKWTWINGRPLTIDKWQKNRPGKIDFYALIAREFPPGSYGSFNSIKGNIQRGCICEEETGVNNLLGYENTIICPLI